MNAAHIDEKAVFNTARRIADAEARSSYLQLACAEHPESMQRVLDLLRVHEEQQSFLESPLPGIDVLERISPLTNQLGDTIGPYKLREQLGEGGMGVVYVAEQTEPVKRKVALKIIKPGMVSQDVLARFEAERQTLAMMEHPNIAKVFDAGTTDTGRPYFVMELVCGAPVTEYCDEHALTTDERLQVFLKVCRAVQHAHQKGVIHRDLKPSNVLVASIDGEAVPKVIDFGVAKAAGPKLTEQTVYTQISQLVGTPLYMSPEQVELGVVDVDTRSDVYSLGVVLYELLTGDTPFASNRLKEAGIDEMRRIIREDEPLRPSQKLSTLQAAALSTVASRRYVDPRQLQVLLQGELDWLVMKALEKDRDRRYESASALAADIERYLHGEPLQACPPSLLYRWKKLATRHKAAFTTVGLVLVVLLLGMAGTGWQAWRASLALSRAEANFQLSNQHLKLAEQQRAIALRNFRRARDTVNEFLSLVDENKLLQNTELTPLRNELMQLARRHYEQFVEDKSQDSSLQGDLADAYLRLGSIAWTVGDYNVGHTAHQQAVMIRRSLAASDPNNAELRYELATTLFAISQVPHEDQISNLRATIEAARDLVDPEQRSTLALAYVTLADALLRSFSSTTGDNVERDEAGEAAHKAEEIFDQLLERAPENTSFQFGLAKSLAMSWFYHQAMGDYDRAKEIRQRSLILLESLAAHGSDEAKHRERLAEGYRAIAEHRKAIEVYHSLLADHPAVVSYQEGLIEQYRGAALENDKTALVYLQPAVDLARGLSSRYPASTQHAGLLGMTLADLGREQLNQQMHDEGIQSLDAAVTILTLVKPYLMGHLADAYSRLVSEHEAAGHIDTALKLQSQVLELNREIRTRWPNNLKRVVTHAANLLQRASLLRQTGKIKEAFAESRAAVAVVEEALVGEAANASAQHILDARMLLRDSHTAMGDYLRHLGRSADAAESYYRAITLEADVIRSASHVVVLNFPNDLYDRWLQMKRASGEEPDAEDVFSTQLATSQQLIQDPKFEQYRWSYQVRAFEFQLRLADWLVSHDRDAEAAEAYAKARTMLEPLLHKRTEVIPIGLHLGWLQQATGATVHLQRKKLNDALATHIQRGLEASRADAPVGDIHSDWNKWIELALGYYRPRQWQDAETDARKAIELARGRLEGLIRMAPLLLLAGDVDEYQALCQDLLSTSTDRHGDALTRTLQLCLLDPEPRDPELLLRTARRAAEETGDDHLLNVAYYRTGQYESAIGGLTEDLKSIANCRPLVELHLALAYHLAGYQEEARTWLAKVKSDCEPIWAVDSKVMFEVVWQQAKYMLD